MGGNKGGGYFVFKVLTQTARLHPDIRCAPTLFGKGSQVETARSWPEQPNLTGCVNMSINTINDMSYRLQPSKYGFTYK